MTQHDEAEEAVVNPLVDLYKQRLEKLQERISSAMIEEGLTKESTLIAGYVRNEVETFVLESGLVDTIGALVRTCDTVAAMSPANIKDNALKRTLMRAAREQGIKISLAGDLVRQLASSNVEVAVAKLYGDYAQATSDLEVAARLALQYDGMKVPIKLKKRVQALKESLKAELKKYPHLADQYKV